MTDNFEQIRGILKFDLPEHFYYVQLLKRQSDDPLVDGKKDPAYHGNMHSRSLKNYYFRDLKTFDAKRAEIIKYCDANNVRAYIRLNRRSNKAVDMEMYEHIYSCLKNGTFKSPEYLLASACGKVNSEPKATRSWLIDVDAEYMPYLKDIKEAANIARSSYSGTAVLHEIPSKHGMHLITHPFNKQDYMYYWKAFTSGAADIPREPAAVHQDNPTILYAP